LAELVARRAEGDRFNRNLDCSTLTSSVTILVNAEIGSVYRVALVAVPSLFDQLLVPSE